MSIRETTGILSRSEGAIARPFSERLLVWCWAIIQWPWLVRSLHGGLRAEKQALLERLDLPADALPNLGSWKADTVFLAHLVDTIERLRPERVVELGCGASSLVLARALQRNGGGRLTSYDQNADFCALTAAWLAEHGLNADIIHAPLLPETSEWASCWYDLSHVPASIDLLVIDGPPWAVNPFVRGGAEVLFDRVAPGGVILLDDAARPGERVVAGRWRRRWRNIAFRYDGRGAKGTLIGQRRA